MRFTLRRVMFAIARSFINDAGYLIVIPIAGRCIHDRIAVATKLDSYLHGKADYQILRAGA
eukprot:10970698-Heterocapsa_arctica.AAC.1